MKPESYLTKTVSRSRHTEGPAHATYKNVCYCHQSQSKKVSMEKESNISLGGTNKEENAVYKI